MEVEARFAIPDQTTYERLRSLDSLEHFVLHNPETIQIDDVYLDTEDRRIARAGYACCLRQQGDRHTVLLRKREIPDPPLHRYERLQAEMPGQLSWPHWPDGQVREELVGLVGDADLEAVLALYRIEECRQVSAGGRRVAELKQDVVRQSVANGQEEFLDLIVRLQEDGTEEELTALIESLRRDFDVLPQPVSRYQRGVAVEGRSPTESPLLTRDEYRRMKVLAQGKKRYARRASALIALHHGATQTEAGAYAGLTDRRVRHWLAAFREKRLAIFPQAILDTDAHAATVDPGPRVGQATTSAAQAPALPTEPAVVPSSAPNDPGPGLDPDDTMTEAARKTLSYHLQEMLAHENATRQGTDPEELHKMRVATRRMRAAVRVFQRYVKKKAMKPYVNALKETARALGRVRDLDVAEGKAQDYMASEAGRGANLDPVLNAWGAAHDTAREDLLAYLDGETYAWFKTAFGVFLAEPLPQPKRLRREDTVMPRRLRHVVPVEVFCRLAEVRAYDPVVTGPDVSLEDYHNLRIAAKRLRYTLEFFEEVLGPEAREAIEALKRLQDYLGDLQDAVVASDRLRNFWLWGTWDPPAEDELLSSRVRPILAPGVARYHAEKQIEIQDALDGFSELWSRFRGPAFGALIARAVSVL